MPATHAGLVRLQHSLSFPHWTHMESIATLPLLPIKRTAAPPLLKHTPVNRYCPTNTDLPGCSPVPVSEGYEMGNTVLLACLLLSHVNVTVCPACRSMGSAGLLDVWLVVGSEQAHTQMQQSVS